MANTLLAQTPEAGRTLAGRIRRILFRPKTEWPVIAAERISPIELLKSYVAPLAAISPIASLIGMAVIGIPVPMLGTIRTPVGEALTTTLLSFGFGLLGVFLMAAVV